MDHNKKSLVNQAGDTIVEVMLAVAVVGFVLTAAFGLANRSRQTVQRSQERGEALKYAESQAEKLKDYLPDSTADWNSGDCIQPDGNPGNQNCRYGTDNRYQASISTSDNKLYTVAVQWERFGGGSTETLTINYRIY